MLSIGNVVLALAGKERGGLFIVVKTEEKYAYICDGKRLKTYKPKKKSYKHLKLFVNEKMPREVVLDPNERANAAVRKFLSKIRSDYV